jgi:hypothetical protein
MRKLTVELAPHVEVRAMKNLLFNKIKSIEAVQYLKTDFDKGVRAGICILTMKDGFSPQDIGLTEGLEVLGVMKTEGNRHTCFVKARFPQEHLALLKKLDMDLIWDAPTIIAENKLIFSVIGDKDNLKRFLEVASLLGEIENVKCQLSAYQERDILSCLTARQREVLLEAKRSGYYDYPRRINGEDLAQKVGISKAATIEHLRKAEARIMSNILSG